MGLIDALVYGLRDVFDLNGDQLPRRSRIKFLCAVDDDPSGDRLTVHASAANPGGLDTQAQYNNNGAFGGMVPVTYNDITEVVTVDSPVFTGAPQHNEDYAHFVLHGDGNGGCARSYWSKKLTTNATATVLVSISVPAAEFGDCRVTVMAHSTYTGDTSKGGKLARESLFKRISGTLSLELTVDESVVGLVTGTATGGLTIVANGNDTIEVKATGISSTNLQWTTSVHVQLVKLPS